MKFIPKKLFLTCGVGVDKQKLTSFEMALREAGIAYLNLVRVSSILPPHCEVIEKNEGLKLLEPGEITFVVLAEMATMEAGRRMVTSVGLARPADSGKYGYLSEHHAFGETELEAGDYAEDLAATMLATTLNIPFDIDKDYNERKDQYMMGKQIVDSTSITMATEAVGGKVWTTVISAAVFCE